jgi:hypothetical protein
MTARLMHRGHAARGVGRNKRSALRRLIGGFPQNRVVRELASKRRNKAIAPYGLCPCAITASMICAAMSS